MGRDYGKRGPIEELQLCCCKFLGRDYGKRGPCGVASANFWGEITLREVYNPRTAALRLQFVRRDYGKRGPIEELQLCCKFLGRDYGKGGLIQELQLFVYNFWGEITVREAQLKNCSFATANFWAEITVKEVQLLQIFGAKLR